MKETVSIVLQDRDRELLEYLRLQGFATFEQIQRQYFPSKSAASHRLGSLAAAGYLKSVTAQGYFRGKDQRFTPILMGVALKPNTKIFTLSPIFRKQIPETNRLLKNHLCLHQIVLGDVMERLNRYLTGFDLVLNDPKLKAWSLIDESRPATFAPDLVYEGPGRSLAIELERTIKSLSRYQERFSFYQNSAYKHVLYVYLNESHLKTLLDFAGRSRRFGFAHYLNPSEVFTNAWGYMPLERWLTDQDR